MITWPNRAVVDRAVRDWARRQGVRCPHLMRVGYFGSYARDTWGVGSDVDLVLIVSHAQRPWAERGAQWPLEALPVPAQAVVYTADEWERMQREGGRFARDLAHDTVWVYP